MWSDMPVMSGEAEACSTKECEYLSAGGTRYLCTSILQQGNLLPFRVSYHSSLDHEMLAKLVRTITSSPTPPLVVRWLRRHG
jgi:hypothetical protein